MHFLHQKGNEEDKALTADFHAQRAPKKALVSKSFRAAAAPFMTSIFIASRGITSIWPSSDRLKPQCSKNSTPPVAAATLCWKAALEVLMFRYFSSSGLLAALAIYLSSVLPAVRHLSSSDACVFFIVTNVLRSLSSVDTGLTTPNTFFFAFSRSSAAAFSCFSASRAFSSSVSSSGLPSFLRRSFLSSSNFCFSLARSRSSASFSRFLASTFLFSCPSCSLRSASCISFPARMRSLSRTAANSRSSFSRFSLAALIRSCAFFRRSSGVSFAAASSEALVTRSG
mmetsp:Transcript_17447/g.48489  ORF Transcript_17447/g.48489 Transcript_17447/m.48489 type:complete len:284 (-) Transcript_17447:632-1483(-)